MSGVLAVAMKELRQIRRDRRSLLILLFIPVFFLFMFGYALSFDIRHVTLAVQDPKRLEALKVGDTVDVTYFESLMISVSRPPK